MKQREDQPGTYRRLALFALPASEGVRTGAALLEAAAVAAESAAGELNDRVR